MVPHMYQYAIGISIVVGVLYGLMVPTVDTVSRKLTVPISLSGVSLRKTQKLKRTTVAVPSFHTETAAPSIQTVDSWHHMAWQPRRCQMPCCGYGDRFHFLETQVEGLTETNHSIAMHWGPCTSKIDNIIDEMFDLPIYTTGDVPDVLPTNFTLYVFKPNVTKNLEDALTGAKNVSNLCDPQPVNEPRDGVTDIPSRKRFKPDFYGILSIPMAHVFKTLFSSIRPKYQRMNDELKREYDWEKTKTISIHVRTGNMIEGEEFRDVRLGSRRMTNVEEMLRRYADMAEKIATILEWKEDFKFFIASDNAQAGGWMRNVTSRPVASRKPLLHIPSGQPMVWANLHENNAGERCRIEWFVDPILDMEMLSSADVFISTSATGFVTSVQSLVYHNDGVICLQNKNEKEGTELDCKRRKSDPLNVQPRWGDALRPRNTPGDFPPWSILPAFVNEFHIPTWFSV
eukprot:m.37237 g.37237  ORF g.37237 m.37237 type:complete len:457 (-) comp17605_c0_seq1:64-1434(-)